MSDVSRYVVGLDLGTTNCAVAYVDTRDASSDIGSTIQSFPILQLVKGGETSAETLLPSSIYIPGEGEIDPADLALPWAKKRSFAVGRWARDVGATVPTRLVSSAKSWLCHAGVDRRGSILPFSAEEGFPRISPVEASRRLLEHLRDAWNSHFTDKGSRLESQEIVLTVPASFDAVARELTIESAKSAGLENVTLFEEPQAAFYAWLHQAGDAWRREVKAGDVVLVVDVGGGTSDFTIIGVGQQAGDLTLERVAVGDHLLLGGDNMDLALAHRAAEEIRKSGSKLDHVQMLGLWHAARAAKEKLLAPGKAESASLTVLGRGRKVIGGTLKTELERGQVESMIVDGFFPRVTLEDGPATTRGLGLQELGLPYVADAAVTRHLASFVRRHQEEIAAFRGQETPAPNIVLFNGGVFQSRVLRQRVQDIVASWSQGSVKELSSASLDQAVAVGAAYYGMVRRGRGIRIRGGVARSYYIGVESAMPAVPGMPRPLRAVCVVPQGTEEGTEVALPAMPFGLVVGEEVEFRFLGSTARKEDGLGTVVDDWEGEMDELAPIRTTIEAKSSHKRGQTIPVLLHGKVTEVGTLELWCQARDGDDKWKLEFNVRETDDG